MQKVAVSPSTFLADSGQTKLDTTLIVDDIEENLDLFEDVLSVRSYRIVRARNGLEALSKHIMDRHGGKISLEPNPDGGMIARLVFITTHGKSGGTNVQR